MDTSFLERLARNAPSDVAAQRPDDAAGLRAAVAAIVRGGELLFIKRAEREGDPWSGHMAFPGGRRDPGDASLLDTARRETLEEIGVDLRAAARPVARLPDIAPFSRLPRPITVTPFVFSLEHPATLAPNEEVASIVWAPLEGVLRGEGATTFRWQRDGLDLELPAIAVGGEIVWGLTYRMIELLREAVG
jgi:8-oxo-dGTP pyrophosphatase MutT (NUDIX family)